MSIFDNLGKKIGETAQAAQKKANETIEITKLNKSISNEEDKIQKIFTELGRKLYGLYIQGQDVGDNFESECEEISVYEDNIKELKNKIRELKNIRICPNCGAEIEEGILFCSKCGTKLEIPAPAAPVKEEKPDFKVCPTCGSKLTLEAAFCPSCGTKQEIIEEKMEEIPQEPKKCPQCGAEVEEGVAFCPSCGTKLN
jgi:predicted amidophosphoribosyltransferase